MFRPSFWTRSMSGRSIRIWRVRSWLRSRRCGMTCACTRCRPRWTVTCGRAFSRKPRVKRQRCYLLTCPRLSVRPCGNLGRVRSLNVAWTGTSWTTWQASQLPRLSTAASAVGTSWCLCLARAKLSAWRPVCDVTSPPRSCPADSALRPKSGSCAVTYLGALG